MCVSPASALETGPMIHYSEPGVNVQDEVVLEQGYSFKVVDMNSNTGAILIKLYLNSEEIDLDDNFAEEDDPFEYIRSVVDEDDDEEDHLILRITPKGSVKNVDGKYYSTLYIEQYLDPVENIDDYLILDEAYSLKSDSDIEFADIYTLEITGIEDDAVSLEFSLNSKVLKEDEVKEGDYFYYTTYSGSQPEAVFLAHVRAFIESGDAVTVFFDEVSLKQISSGSKDNDDEAPDKIDIRVGSPVGGDLKAGDVAIITYDLNEAFTEVRILVDGEFVDSRKDVSKGSYKAVTDELGAGIHNVMLIMIDDDKFSYYSEDFSVSVNIKDNITQSISGIASSAVESIINNNNSSNESSMEAPITTSSSSGSGFSSMLSLVITAGVFVVFFIFYNKFR